MKKFIIKIMIAVILVITSGVIIYFSINPLRDPNEKDITIIVIDKNGNEIINDDYTVTDESLFEIMEENYEIEYSMRQYGAFILEIEDIKTDGMTSYIAVNINGEASPVGISSIVIEDGAIYSFVETII